jgi:hypothetical protein
MPPIVRRGGMGQAGLLDVQQQCVERGEFAESDCEREELVDRLAAVVELRRRDQLIDQGAFPGLLISRRPNRSF